MQYKEKYFQWLGFIKEKDERDELLSLENDQDIKERFYKDINFGTGGLRGIMSLGTNCINIYTVRRRNGSITGSIKISNNWIGVCLSILNFSIIENVCIVDLITYRRPSIIKDIGREKSLKQAIWVVIYSKNNDSTKLGPFHISDAILQ